MKKIQSKRCVWADGCVSQDKQTILRLVKKERAHSKKKKNEGGSAADPAARVAPRTDHARGVFHVDHCRRVVRAVCTKAQLIWLALMAVKKWPS
jgi:hypothetical protein